MRVGAGVCAQRLHVEDLEAAGHDHVAVIVDDARDVRLVRLVAHEAFVVVPAGLDDDEDVPLGVDRARDADVAEAGLLAEEAAVFVEFGEEAARLRGALEAGGLDLHEDGLDVLHAGFRL